MYVGENKPKTSIISFEAAKEVLLTAEKPTIESRRFERIKNMIACKSYNKNLEIPGNKEIFFYGFKHIKTDKVGNYIIIRCESEELYENLKLISFWSNKFIKKDRKQKFNITGWSFMTLVKKTMF